MSDPSLFMTDQSDLVKAVGRFLDTLGPLYNASETGDAAAERNAYQKALTELAAKYDAALDQRERQ